ncbi:uncharacterized protein EDB91DRAFT_1083351 [Suillus paluster]|uniref:uncharacterized protein n=1 Tax=Suillus paluster TaxID=48578 RepID=UPI001B872847|nr:uncharacterized protein EDB91DRAFT_1083351 [Suillus paluster]KAG1736692.1 hypothetical protein EDB91DRAFT_1083351 [Suillus paluster]
MTPSGRLMRKTNHALQPQVLPGPFIVIAGKIKQGIGTSVIGVRLMPQIQAAIANRYVVGVSNDVGSVDFDLLRRTMRPEGIVVTVNFCGYLVGEEWLFQRGVDLGHPHPVTVGDVMEITCLASSDVRTATGVYFYTKLRRVKTLKGNSFWCIAFAILGKAYQPARRRRKNIKL